LIIRVVNGACLVLFATQRSQLAIGPKFAIYLVLTSNLLRISFVGNVAYMVGRISQKVDFESTPVTRNRNMTEMLSPASNLPLAVNTIL